jgi:hypothetical protein
MVMSRDQHTGKNRNVHVGRKVIERIETFGYLGTNITQQSSIHEEIKNNLSQGMLAIIDCRIFCLTVCYTKI